MHRPNARISDARKRKAAQRAGGPALSPVAQARITEAGASAYAWRDRVLTDLYAPPRGFVAALWIASGILQFIILLAIALVALQGGGVLLALAPAIPAAVAVLLYLATKKLSPIPALAWLAAASVASIPMISASPTWGALGVLVVVVAVLASHEVENPRRGEISTWISTITTLGFGALAHSTGLSWWPTALWSLVLIVAQVPICVLHRNFRSTGHRITPDDLLAKVPDPAFKWQSLVDVLRRIPGLVFVISEWTSHEWLEQVLEAPPEHIMKEARKKAAGAYGERKTAVILLALSRDLGAMIFHDVCLPGAKSANIDHIVITTNHEGKPCAFIIDSKFYGPSRLPSRQNPHGKDPGEITYDATTQGYVHRIGTRSREIDSSIRTALWGADAVRRVTGIDDVRVIMAIHNANVAPHLSFDRKGVPVQIVSAWDIVTVIEQASTSENSWVSRLLHRVPSSLSPTQQARVFQAFTAASGNHQASAYKSLGRTRKAEYFLSHQSAQARGGDNDLRFGPPSPRAAASYSPTPRPATDDSTAETPFEKADHEFFHTDPSAWSDDSPPRPPVPPAQSAAERLAGLWEDMRNSAPAPPDDVPERYRGIVQGTPLTITSFNEEHGPIAQNVVAITGVCAGAPGRLFLWYCSPEGWRQYQNTKMPVFISTIDVQSVIVRDRGEE